MATVVDRETDARFWASTGYRVGQKLDPKDPNDKKMIPVWVDVHAKVQREYDAGQLVTTFDHPVVAQNLADAHVADQAAAAHLDAAAKAPDPTVAQQHVDAAAAAANVVAQKTHEVATIQPATASPQLTHEVAQEARHDPPPPSAPAKDHLANAQAQAAHKSSPRSLLDKETDARFWSQTHFKPGQKLDPKDPQDAKMIPVWLDIYRKVKLEDDAGRLVLTYNHPVVAQNLADARVADQAAAAHLDTAVVQPQAAPQNIAAAATAAQVSAQKTREAARLQPPSVSPNLAHDAARQSDERSLIIRETNARFWAQTHHKPGQPLDPRDPQDARMLPLWRSIFAQVQYKHLSRETARKPLTGRDQLAQEQAKGAGRRAAEVHHHHRKHRRSVRSAVHPRSVQDYRTNAAGLARAAGAPFVIVGQGPDGTPVRRTFGSRAELDAEYGKLSEQHDQYKYVAAFDLAADPNAPVHDSVGVPAAEHAEVPPEVTAPAPSASSTEAAAPPVPSTEITPVPTTEVAPPEKKTSTGKIVAIALGLVGVGGLVYVMSRKTSLPRERSPRVFVTTPPSTGGVSVTPTRALRS
jgi:hypothetical protein